MSVAAQAARRRTTAPTTRRSTLGLMLLLGTMITIGPATIDMYLPALPRIADDLNASDAAVQLTLAGTMFGMAVGQLVIGPLSDAFGRRRPLLIGVVVHVAASLGVLVIADVGGLGVLRLFQGFGAAGSATIAMAVIRDLWSGVRAAQVLSRLMLVMGMAPILAPSVGSVILRFADWRSIFGVLAGISLLVALGTALLLPETLPPARRRPARPAALAATIGSLLRDRAYVGLIFVSGLTFVALFAYVSGSSFVLQQTYGLSATQFGLAFSGGAIGMIVMTQVNVPLVGRYGPGRLLVTGLCGAFASALVLVAAAATGFGGLFGVLVPIWAMMSFIALTFPNTPALALSRHGDAAGTAAALLGSTQFLIGSLAAPLLGVLGSGSALPMALVMAGAFALALLLLGVVVRSSGLRLPAVLDGDTEGETDGDTALAAVREPVAVAH